MTEKRFISATYNNQSWLLLYLGENEYESYRPSELLDLLNGLVDENEKLKYESSKYMVELNNLKGEYSVLEIENEQLKKELESERQYILYLKSVLEDNEIWYND